WPPVSVTDAYSPPSNRICRSTPAKTVVSLVALAVQLVQRWEVLSLIGTLFSANQDTSVSGTAPGSLVTQPRRSAGRVFKFLLHKSNHPVVRTAGSPCSGSNSPSVHGPAPRQESPPEGFFQHSRREITPPNDRRSRRPNSQAGAGATRNKFELG